MEEQSPTLLTVVSRDGTRIGYWRSGSGRPLVLVHGVAVDHGRWEPVLPALEERFTVYAIDRRGRGGSGDTRGYRLQREYEDIAAVIDQIAQPVDLVAHSFGGLCALEAARLTEHVGRLVLYEPGVTRTWDELPVDAIEWLDGLLARSERDELVATFLGAVVGIPPAEIERLRRTPGWQRRLALAHTIPREMRAMRGYRFDPRRYQDVTAPTLLLFGGESPPSMREEAELLEQVLPGAYVDVLPDQRHVAMDTAPDLFAEVLLRHLG